MELGDTPLTVVLVGPADTTARLAEAVGTDQGLTVLATVEADDLTAAVAGGAPDIVVLSAVGEAELDAAGQLARTAAATRFVAVVEDAPAIDPAVLVTAGIGAVVTDPGGSDLVAVIRGLAHGEAFLDAALARHVIDANLAAGLTLSATEDEVLGRLAAGETDDDIADDHAVSPRLVRLHAGGALARLLP